MRPKASRLPGDLLCRHRERGEQCAHDREKQNHYTAFDAYVAPPIEASA